MAEDGLNDIRHGLESKPDSAFGYSCLGIYHLDRGEHEQAREYFEKARALDGYMNVMDDYLARTNRRAEIQAH